MSAAATYPTDAFVLLLAAFQIGLANGISRGQWNPASFGLLCFALAMLVWQFLRTRGPTETAALSRRSVAAGVVVLLAVLALVGVVKPGIAPASRAFELGLLVLVVSYTPFLGGRSEPAWLRRSRFVLFALAVLGLGVLAIRLDPRPPIDVWHIQVRGIEVLLEGKDPYVWAQVPDTDPESNFVVPYVYPPPALYAGTLAWVVARDPRYAMLAAIVVTGFGLRAITATPWRARSELPSVPSVLEDAPALVFWLTPVLPVVVELAWIDPLQIVLVVLFVAAATLTRGERKTAAGVALGLAVASKQSMFWLVPLAVPVLRRDRRAWAAAALAFAAAILPFLVWDAAAMKRACFDLLSGLPPRRDALNFTNAVWQWARRPFPPAAAWVLAAIVAAGTLLRKDARPLAIFAEGALLTYFVFFFFNRWAFANYYFLLTAFAGLAAATRTAPTE
jgi:hypothetical protein